MRKSFVSLLSLVLFLGVLLTVGCGGGGGGGSSPTAPVADGSLADLNGKVTYLGKPVANAAVYLIKVTDQQSELSRRASLLTQPEPDFSVLTADGNGYQTTSDANGNYTFAQVPVGTYTLDASISPTIRVSQSVVVGAISNLDLALKPTGSISGKVTLNGNPIQAMVFLQGTSYIGITDLSGSFTIMNVPVETTPYTLIPVVPSGYYPGSLRVALSVTTTPGQMPASLQPETSVVQGSVKAVPYGSVYAFKNSPVQVTPVAGTNTDLGTLELIAATGTLTGTALIEGSNMHSGIYVTAAGRSAYTDSEGKYTLQEVYFGQQTVTFSKVYGSETYTGSTVVLVDAVATKTVDTVTLRPQSATSAKIDVSLIGLNDTSYVSFELWQQDGSYADESNGSYSPATFPYSGLEPGTYYVKVYPGSNFTLLNPAAGSTDLLTSITVAAGGNASFVAYLQYNKANLTGTISGIDANFPVSNVSLSPGYSGYVSGTGYSISAVTPGNYTLSVSATGYTSYSSAVTLTAGNNTKNFALTPTFPTVSAVSYTAPTVTVTGTRLGTANIYIAPQGGSYSSYTPTRTATQMTYDATGLNPGVYTVKAYGADGAVSTNSNSFSKPFVSGPTVISGISLASPDVGTTTYNLRWSSLPGATSYLVKQGATSIATVNSSTYNYLFTGLQPNTPYTFSVEAIGNGISNSVPSSATITTNKLFATPERYTVATINSMANRSFMVNNGYLYVISTNNDILRYNAGTPNVGVAPVALTLPATDARITDLYADASNVYVGWATGTYVYLQRYNSDLSGTPTTYSASFSNSAGGMKVLKLPGAANVLALTYDTTGVASLTQHNAATLAPSSPVAKTLPVGIEELEWTSLVGNDGSTNYIAILLNGNNMGYDFYRYFLYDTSLTVEYDSDGDGAHSGNDICRSPNQGFAWTRSNNPISASNPGVFFYSNPTIPFGTEIQLSNSTSSMGYQTAIDGNNQFYVMCGSSLTRYTPTGVPNGTISFPLREGYKFGQKLLQYDSLNQQIIVLDDSNETTLEVMIFGTRN